MSELFIILAIVLGVIAYKLHSSANKYDRGYSDVKPKSSSNGQPAVNQASEVKKQNPAVQEKVEETNDSEIDIVGRYNSWAEYRQKHPQRATEITSLGIDLSRKSNKDASEWIFAIETTAKDSKCRISELKKVFFETFEKNNIDESEWIYVVKDTVEFAKKESEKYNLKIGNTAGDMFLLFVLNRIREIETKHANAPALTTTDPQTLQMRFLLDSDDDVLMMQKLHIYVRKYPLTPQNKRYRDNFHNNLLSTIQNRIARFDNMKSQPQIYNMAVTTEIHKMMHDELLEMDNVQDLINEFNSHLLSLHEEVEIISHEARKKFLLTV